MDAPASLINIPPELLGEILYQCSTLSSDAPLILSQVSRGFHQVVHTTPRVWENLQLHVSDGDNTRSAHRSKLWFSMVGTCMVNVQVEIVKPDHVDPTGFGNLSLKEPPPPSFAVSKVLRQHLGQIRSLAVESPSEFELRVFLNSIYGDDPNFEFVSHELACLSALTLQISSTPLPSLSSRTSHLSSPLPHLPHLQTLKLINHSVSCLASCRFEQLRRFSITCPVRFPPIRLSVVLDVLRSSPLIEDLSIESRIVDTPGVSATTDDESDIHSTLIHLPNLTRISLRINTIPSFLNQLLLPNLHTLRLDDLNGKRPNISEETAVMLRQLLVRMELPNEHRRGTGLKILELIGIAIDHHPERQESGMWEWCFRRMKSLEELHVSRLDSSPLLDILTPPLSTYSTPLSTHSLIPSNKHRRNDIEDDVICPLLQRLSIIDSSSLPTSLDRFRRQRPTIKIEFDVVLDPLSPVISSTPIDFLSLYADKNQPSCSPPVSPKAESSLSSRRLPTNPLFGFGPWLVLAQRPDGSEEKSMGHGLEPGYR